MATGAPSLAIMSGAPLLPVLLARRDWRTFEVIVKAPLAPPEARDRGQARESLLLDYAAILQEHFAADPAAFADWRNLAPGRRRAEVE